VDVVAEPSQTFRILERDALEATLEDMPVPLAVAIEAGLEDALQPAHPFAQVGMRSLESEMVVVAHHAAGVKNPAAALASLVQGLAKGTLRAIRTEDPISIVAPVDHVVETALALESNLALRAMKTSKNTILRYQGYWIDPFLTFFMSREEADQALYARKMIGG